MNANKALTTTIGAGLALLAAAGCDSGDAMGGPDAAVTSDASLDAGVDAQVVVDDGGTTVASLEGCTEGEFCRCPMMERDGRTYVLCPDAVSHAQAVTACESTGLSLVRIESEEEQAWVWDQAGEALERGAKDLWIGLDDREEEGVFRWNDGSEPTYVNWAEDQPDHGGTGEDARDEDCVEMGSYIEGRWNDLSCETDYLGFVCEG
ncbi:MAG TPA: C-type lectin domain-containing protein [Sandaracinaceae bacterium LLY-WYZ-13_1]|nr:C-type lectin domain-containing protein [Sandaracinaceae bacterium LLY-WYZ-13_1]